MPHGRCLTTSLFVLVILAAPSATAAGDVLVPAAPQHQPISKADRDLAERAYAEARRAYQNDDLKAALAAAEEAFKAMSNANTALIKAVIHAEAGDHRGALLTYLLAMTLGPTDDESMLIHKGLAEASISATPKMGWVLFRTDPVDARISIPGARSFVAPRAVGLAPGRYTITVSAPKRRTRKTSFRVLPGQGQTIQIDLAHVAKTKKKPKRPMNGVAKVAPPPSPNRTAPVVMFASAGLLAVGGGLFYLWASEAAEDMEEFKDPPATGPDDPNRQQRWEDARTNKATGEALAWVSWGLAGALTVTGAIIWATQDEPERSSGVLPRVGPIPGGAAIWLQTGF